jgi:hypothetical protein
MKINPQTDDATCGTINATAETQSSAEGRRAEVMGQMSALIPLCGLLFRLCDLCGCLFLQCERRIAP